ncbi:MAG: 1-acyl-sn-glycerol-3-phosphate acyltransferase [Clostridiales Family XIII bacterium]|jgi:1-acyl-sn-glycerol-3-phosphate acyltransferase|nr:1-acyl-sn-glycerol-3-phosphate acyltransferase [Clostridiales Family XIII bacterium]
MNLFKTVPFAVYMFGLLARMASMGRNIDRCRAEQNYEEEQKWILRAENFWGANICEHFGFEIEAEYEGSLPEGPVLFVSNHEAYADIAIFVATIKDKQVGFVAKGELEKVPWYGGWISRVRSLYIKRGDARATLRLFDEGEEWLREGFSLAIFPEGTRAKTGGMASFQRGSLRMALRTGVPIVPVTLKGTYHLFEEKGYPVPGRVKFYIHRAVETKGLDKSEQAALSEKIEAVIRGKLTEWEEAI